MTIHMGRPMLIVAAVLALVGVGAVLAGLIAPLPLLWVGLIVAGPLAMVFRMRGMRGGQAPAVRLVDPPEQSEHMADPGA